MEKPSILHLLTTAKNMSPFDVNMAIDAGFAHIVPYTNVLQNEVIALTQDAMFSRSPSGVKREAMFFGGRDIHTALAMQQAAKNAMYAPFQFSSFADPSGAFTTAAAMLAKINAKYNIKNQTVAIFGASGPVGATAALIAAENGAQVILAAHREMAAMQAHADELQQRYGVQLQVAAAHDDTAKIALLKRADMAICAAAAGVRVLEHAHFAQSTTLKIMADVNAVAPSGVAGLEAMNDGQAIESKGEKSSIIGIGALAIGQLKYATQHAMLKQLLAGTPQHLAYQHAFETACALSEFKG